MHIGPIAIEGELNIRVGDHMTAPCGLHIEHRGSETEVVCEDGRVDEVLEGLLACLTPCDALLVLGIELALAHPLGGGFNVGFGGWCACYDNGTMMAISEAVMAKMSRNFFISTEVLGVTKNVNYCTLGMQNSCLRGVVREK